MSEQVDQPAAPGVTGLRGSNGVARLASRAGRLVEDNLIFAAVIMVILGQLAEDLADGGVIQMATPGGANERWTIILVTVYMLLTSRAVDRLVDRCIATLRDTLQMDPQRFAVHARSLRRPGPRLDVVLLATSAVVVTLLYVVLGSSLPVDDPVTGQPTFLPPAGPAAALILAQYILVGWAVLLVVAVSVRRAVALRRLSTERLPVDVFDTSDLLPLGNIALGSSLAPAGIIVVLLLGLGQPSSPLGWSILLVAVGASVLGLVLPLRPIHRQMVEAKRAVLQSLNARVRAVYGVVTSDQDLEGPEAIRFNNETNMLLALRRTASEMTTWPFRDTLAFGRALLIASAPLIYTATSELIKLFWISPLTR